MRGWQSNVGRLIRSFTFDRNTYRRDAPSSAAQVHELIQLVDSKAALNKVQSNSVIALTNFAGLFRKSGTDLAPTDIGSGFERMYSRSPADAYQWLLTRALWRYVVPNSTGSAVNADARALGITFGFFGLLLAVLTHFAALSGSDRFVYYEELCAILDDDRAWALPATELFERLLSLRRTAPAVSVQDRRALLGDLEDDYSIPRDNLAGVFRKALAQTGLFEFAENSSGQQVGIALNSGLDEVLQSRVRFVLDNPVAWEGTDWVEHVALQSIDLPQEVSLVGVPEAPESESGPVRALDELLPAYLADLGAANMRVSESLALRLLASTITKPFVILTGMSGSGKTKLAQALAIWFNSRSRYGDPFVPGLVIEAPRGTYTVIDADRLSISLAYSDGKTLVSIPRQLVQEWAEVIADNGFGRSTPKADIVAKVADISNYSNWLNSGFDSVLKAAAFSLIEAVPVAQADCYAVVPVGPDWTTSESVLGYADALDASRYVRTQTLDLMLRATSDPDAPYFLILDEMNLSHVERYFADLLSAIESSEPVSLHCDSQPRQGVPSRLRLPSNLFVLGTVNVDETTYMFSPKVLDRANVLEFRVGHEEIAKFLEDPTPIEMGVLVSAGKDFAAAFLSASRGSLEIDQQDLQRLQAELDLFASIDGVLGELGFRTAKEVSRFLAAARALRGADWRFDEGMDAQIVQKLLPKLHGSRRAIEPMLCAWATLCYQPRVWDRQAGVWVLANADAINAAAVKALLFSDGSDPLDDRAMPAWPVEQATYPISFEKVTRMLRLVRQNGFASFAEA